MEDQRSEAPELELTAAVPTGDADGADALQVIPTDSPETDVTLGDAFHITIHKKPDPAPPMKASKPVTAEANDSVVAALMGRPIGMVKPGAGPVASAPATIASTMSPVESTQHSDAVSNSEVKAEVALAEPRPSRPRSPGAAAQAVDRPASAIVLLNESTARAATSNTPVLTIENGSTGSSASPRESRSAPSPTRIAASASPLIAKPPITKPPITKPPVAPAVPAVLPKRAIPVAPVWPSPSAASAGGATPTEKFAAKPAPVPSPPHLYVPPAPTRQRPEPPAPAPRPASPIPAPSIKAESKKPAIESPAKKFFPPEPEDTFESAGSTGAWWTIPLTFVGIAIVACAMLIPAADENRRDNYELAKIERDVDYFDRQSAVNQDFLKRVNTDATLAERLAMRQLHQTRQGVKLAPINGKPDRFGASPYAMTRLDPPPPLPPYQPVPGRLSEWFLGGKNPQQMAGLGLVVAGAGVMLGGLRKRQPI